MSTLDSKSTRNISCSDSPNIIYIQAYETLEPIEITSECTTDDIQEILRSICGAGRRDSIKLINYQNVILPLLPSSLVPNLPSQPYRVEVISCCPQLFTSLLSSGARRSLQELDTRVKNVEIKMQTLFSNVQESSSSHIVALEGRINRLQSQVHTVHLSRQMERHTVNIVRSRNTSEILARCSSCPYFSNMHHLQQNIHLNDLVTVTNRSSVSCNWYRIAKTHEQIHTAWIQYQSLQTNEIRRPIRESLKLASFNMWGYTDTELLQLTKSMFQELQLTTKFSISDATLDQWLFAVYQNYNSVPFHNFKHAFCVVQMVYSIIHIAKLRELYDDLEILTLLFSAISHDLDHPGLNNAFQVNARTCLAQRYNDQSPLENHHCAMAFALLEDEEKNILKHLTEKEFKKLREISIKCILATDMARHADIVSDFRALLPIIDVVNDPSHRIMVMVVVIKACDISNEARPPHVSEIWLEWLLDEFFQQSDLEKREGMPFAPFMDREKVTKSNSQCGFIKFVIMPLFELLVQLFPTLEDHILQPVRSQLEYYTKQQSIQSLPTTVSVPVAAILPPVRKISAGSGPAGRNNNQLSSVSDSIQGPIISPIRKTSTGSNPSRKSSTGSMVTAQS